MAAMRAQMGNMDPSMMQAAMAQMNNMSASDKERMRREMAGMDASKIGDFGSQGAARMSQQQKYEYQVRLELCTTTMCHTPPSEPPPPAKVIYHRHVDIRISHTSCMHSSDM
jgi:hypothetical protein